MKRGFRRPDLWAVLTWVLVLAVLAIVLTSEAMCPVPRAPTAARKPIDEGWSFYGHVEEIVETAGVVYGQND